MQYIDTDQVLKEASDADIRLYESWRATASEQCRKQLKITIPHAAWKIRTTGSRYGGGYAPECLIEVLPGWDLIVMQMKLSYSWGIYVSKQGATSMEYVSSLADIGRIVFPDLTKARAAALAQPGTLATLHDEAASDDAVFAELLRQARIEIAQYDGIELPPEPQRKQHSAVAIVSLFIVAWFITVLVVTAAMAVIR